jgi:hypothetical protein
MQPGIAPDFAPNPALVAENLMAYESTAALRTAVEPGS